MTRSTWGGLTRQQRFWMKVDTSDEFGCWEWTGSRTRKGYGHFWIGGTHTPAHRFMYELAVGPIPEGLQLDHLCRNRGCVNPAHLEPVTPKENTRRGISALVNGGRNAAKTHCPYGHLYDEANTYVDKYGWRQCRECKRQFGRKARTGWKHQRQAS